VTGGDNGKVSLTEHTPPRIDPSPRDRILEATVELIVDIGTRDVTHRRVAKAAGVSLSATTYYFESLDDLLEQAFSHSLDSDTVDELWAKEDPIRALAVIVHRLAADRRAVILASELAVVALRNERLAELARRWNDAWENVLADNLDGGTSRLAVLLATGLLQASPLAKPPYDLDDIETLLRQGLQGLPAAPRRP
jgi:DNA-binding transcriptional regulator YbjK